MNFKIFGYVITSDDNIPLSVKEWFGKKGIDAVKAIEVGLKGADDESIYRFALENGFKIVTLNLDFSYLFLIIS